jgi:hypothetical protein
VVTFRERNVENTEDCNAPAQPPRFPWLGIQGSAVAAAVTSPGVSADAQGPQQVCPLFEGGEAAQRVAAESRGSGNKTNDAPTTAAGCYQRNRTTPDADIAAAAMADRRVPLVHQHTNGITSDEHEAAIHSEDLTRDPTRARARKGEGDVP